MIDLTQLIITVVIIIINLIILIVNFVKAIINKVKRSKGEEVETTEAEDIEAIENSADDIVEIVKTIVPQAMMQAEQAGIVGSDNKKLLALSKVLLDCEAKGIDYKKNAELINDTIENLITFSKNVNANKGGV